MDINREKLITNAKAIGGLVSEGSSMMLVCGLARAVLPPQVNVVVKCGVLLGGYMLGGFLGKQVGNYISDEIDETVKTTDEVKAEYMRQLNVLLDNYKKEDGVG